MTTDLFQDPQPKIHFMLVITKISKNKSLINSAEPTSVSSEPSVSCGEASQSVLVTEI